MIGVWSTKIVHGEIFGARQDPSLEWPTCVKLFKDKMYLEERLCVPMGLQNKLVRDHHSFLGHVGFHRLWEHMLIRFAFADQGEAKKFAQRVMGLCETCQACQRPQSLKRMVESTPMPPRLMVSVALDLFRMPTVIFQGEKFDTISVCVDRHSGWIVALPCLDKGHLRIRRLLQTNSSWRRTWIIRWMLRDINCS